MPDIRTKKSHMTHLEDDIFLGPEGLDELTDTITDLISYVEEGSTDKLYAAVKVDGSPALFLWSQFPGYPDNSVALKSFLSGPQTAFSSMEQVERRYPEDSRANMRDMMRYGLELAKYIPANECWQGDCLFTKDSKQEEEINGVKYITFQPNTIVYAYSAENPDYDKIKKADFGIYFHTIYSGEEKTPSFNIDLTRINCPDNIYLMSSAAGNITNKEDFKLDEVKKEFETLKPLVDRLYADPEYNVLVSNKQFQKFWDTYENNVLADRQLKYIDESNFFDDLKSFINTKQEKAKNSSQIQKLKSAEAKQKHIDNIDAETAEIIDIITKRRKLIHLIVQTLNKVIKIKMYLWQGFKQLHTSQNKYKNFYKSKSQGYIEGAPEGIAVNNQDGNIVKLIDRAEFSSRNRDPDIIKGWQHNEGLEENMKINEELDTLEEVAKYYDIPVERLHVAITNLLADIPSKDISEANFEDWD